MSKWDQRPLNTRTTLAAVCSANPYRGHGAQLCLLQQMTRPAQLIPMAPALNQAESICPEMAMGAWETAMEVTMTTETMWLARLPCR